MCVTNISVRFYVAAIFVVLTSKSMWITTLQNISDVLYYHACPCLQIRPDKTLIEMPIIVNLLWIGFLHDVIKHLKSALLCVLLHRRDDLKRSLWFIFGPDKCHDFE